MLHFNYVYYGPQLYLIAAINFIHPMCIITNLSVRLSLNVGPGDLANSGLTIGPGNTVKVSYVPCASSRLTLLLFNTNLKFTCFVPLFKVILSHFYT